jgi:Rab3 GTPase-activating protein regulatory subunit N-terminus
MTSVWSSNLTPDYIDRCAMSPDGKRLAIVADEVSKLILYDLESGEANEIDLPALSTCLVWCTSFSLCISLESGDLFCIDVSDGNMFEYKFIDKPIASVRVENRTNTQQLLWVLYEGGQIIVVLLADLLNGSDSEPLSQFQLVGSEDVTDIVVLPACRPRLYSPFSLRSLEDVNSLIISGNNPSLAHYNVGGNQYFQDMGKLAGYVKAKVTGYISTSISSLYGRIVGIDKLNKKNSQSTSFVPISSLVDFDDEKRRILRLSVDPTSRFLAASDSLARVLLFDLRLMVVVRCVFIICNFICK